MTEPDSAQMPNPSLRVSAAQRFSALVAFLCTVVALVVLVVSLVSNLAWLLFGLLALALLVGGGWVAVTERLPRRLWGLLVGGIGLVGLGIAIVAAAATNSQNALLRLAILLAAGLTAAVAARLALEPFLHAADEPTPTHPPRHPVLICNPWSGGGKVTNLDIPSKAEDLGIEVVMLEKGVDLEALARDAIARGADCIGMAGGDGSQALVASVAVKAGVPYVCISAGTRNHFAQDLGLDKEDPVAGLAAFTEGVERCIDYGTVGDRLFLNNVSLGVYATVVQEDSYRGEKLGTAVKKLPQLLSSTAEPFDLQFTDPNGEAVEGAFLVLVSNNPYVSGLSPDTFQRRSLNDGTLGVMAVTTATGAEAAALVTRTVLGRADTDPNLRLFTTTQFEVRSRSGRVDAGIDGEALELPTPLVFRSHPGGLKLLVPPSNVEAAARRRARGMGLSDLWSVVKGIPPERFRN